MLARFACVMALLSGTTSLEAQYRADAFTAEHRANYFVEAGGSAGLLSLNTDLVPVSQVHLRVGGGLLFLAPSIPITATFVSGHGTSALEIGGGPTNSPSCCCWGTGWARSSSLLA